MGSLWSKKNPIEDPIDALCSIVRFMKPFLDWASNPQTRSPHYPNIPPKPSQAPPQLGNQFPPPDRQRHPESDRANCSKSLGLLLASIVQTRLIQHLDRNPHVSRIIQIQPCPISRRPRHERRHPRSIDRAHWPFLPSDRTKPDRIPQTACRMRGNPI
jgi:hypothetical protein